MIDWGRVIKSGLILLFTSGLMVTWLASYRYLFKSVGMFTLSGEEVRLTGEAIVITLAVVFLLAVVNIVAYWHVFDPSFDLYKWLETRFPAKKPAGDPQPADWK